jgi:site-specific DNA-cytosine methylase/intein/homing endonuclease
MNILSLFDGISCGRIALERADIKIDNYFASEIDKYSIQVAMYNYPSTIQLGDVRNLDVNNLPKIDLLIGGSPCFLAGTKVITKNEIKNIEDIKVGDYVLTHTNTYQKVLKIGGCEKEILNVKCQGINGINTTMNHPFYVRTSNWIYDSNARMKKRTFTEPYWKNAGELIKSDFLGFPIIKTEINHYNLTEEECYIIGRYIADGHTSKNYKKNRPNDRYWNLILSIGDNKVDDFLSHIKTNHCNSYKHTQSTHRVMFCNKRLVQIVEENCGCGAENKTISKKLLDLPVNLLEILIDGYISGDGCKLKSEKYAMSTVSDKICLPLSLAIAKVYRTGFNYNYFKPKSTTIIEGRIVNQRPVHSLFFYKNIKKQMHYKVIDDIIWFPFKQSKNTNEIKHVYNLEVENDNSYTANGIIVHNCTNFSFAGKKNGMITKDNVEILNLETYLYYKNNNFEFEGQSYLFWELVRILKEVKPKYFLLENVVMSDKWKKVITETIGVEPIFINSRLVSAQDRKRLYWTNIPNITQPNDKNISFQDIVGDNLYCGAMRGRRINPNSNSRSDYDRSIPIKQYIESRSDNKTNCLTTVRKDNVVVDSKAPRRTLDEVKYRWLTPNECEALQTLPNDYTSIVSDNQRTRLIGLGWTVDVIAHIFSYIPKT